MRLLFPHFQAIVMKYLENFQGTPVADSSKLDGEVTESDCGQGHGADLVHQNRGFL